MHVRLEGQTHKPWSKKEGQRFQIGALKWVYFDTIHTITYFYCYISDHTDRRIQVIYVQNQGHPKIIKTYLKLLFFTEIIDENWVSQTLGSPKRESNLLKSVTIQGKK